MLCPNRAEGRCNSLVRVLQLVNDEVELVPAAEGEQAEVRRQSDAAERVGALPGGRQVVDAVCRQTDRQTTLGLFPSIHRRKREEKKDYRLDD